MGLPSCPRPVRPSRALAGHDSAVGQYRHKRSITDIGLAMLTPLVGRSSWTATTSATRSAGASSTGSSRCSPPRAPPPASSGRSRGRPPTRLSAGGADYFDLTPDDDQKMIVETVGEFAGEILRPAARDADAAATCPRT